MTQSPSRRIPNFRGQFRYVNPDWAESLSYAGLGDYSKWKHFHNDQCIAGDADSRTRVYRVNTDKGPVIFKRYQIRSAWRYFLRPGRAMNEWIGLNLLQQAGIPVPQTIAVGEDRSMGRLTQGYIISREIENTTDLATFALEYWYGLEKEKKQYVQDEIKNKLFAQLKLAHANNLFHRDLMFRNILVNKVNDGYQLWWIDCPRLVLSKTNMDYLELVDLSCLGRLCLSVFRRSEQFRLLLDFYDGDRVKARKRMRDIADHHKRSRNQPQIFTPR